MDPKPPFALLEKVIAKLFPPVYRGISWDMEKRSLSFTVERVEGNSTAHITLSPAKIEKLNQLLGKSWLLHVEPEPCHSGGIWQKLTFSGIRRDLLKRVKRTFRVRLKIKVREIKHTRPRGLPTM